MIPATEPVQRPADARLLVVDEEGVITERARADLASLVRAGDLVVANDAATLPASLAGLHLASGAPIEVRLAGRADLVAVDRWDAITLGAGDHHLRTEDRGPPPVLAVGDTIVLGPLVATVEHVHGHPRYIGLRFSGEPDAIWAGLAQHGRPIQYAHLRSRLALWDVWTPIAGPPVAFEAPSAGFVLDWHLLSALRAHGAGFATLTHTAGLSSTGDPVLDARLPFDEPYRIPAVTAAAVERTRRRGGRVIAIGTSVVRALESAADEHGLVRASEGLATGRIEAGRALRVVDAIVSGTHEPGTSHHALLGAFLDGATLTRADLRLEAGAYRTHEFGDSVWIARGRFPSPALRGNDPAHAAQDRLPDLP